MQGSFRTQTIRSEVNSAELRAADERGRPARQLRAARSVAAHDLADAILAGDDVGVTTAQQQLQELDRLIHS